MSSWKRRNRRRRTSLKELGPRRRPGVHYKEVDRSPEIEVIVDKSMEGKRIPASMLVFRTDKGPV